MNKFKSFLSNVSLLEWIVLPLGLIAAINYTWIMDDAFVYFRYVDNFLFLGNGLVFNAGEYAEGYSSPLWCLLLIPFRATGMDFWVIIRLLAAISFILLWLMLIRINQQLSPKGSWAVNAPLLFLAFNYGVSSYFSSGLEAPLVVLAGALFALMVLNPASLTLQILMGLMPLVRHELALPILMVMAWCWYKNKRFPWALAISSGTFTGLWLAFRVYYYADFLPTTFYLKNLMQIKQGLYYLHNVLWPYKIYFILPLAAFGLWHLHRRRTGNDGESPNLQITQRLVMLAMAAGITAYVVKIGGDSRHFRYLAFPFVISIAACGGIVEHLLRHYKLEAHKVAIVIGGLILAFHSFMFYPQQFMVHPTDREMACERMPKIKGKRLRPMTNFIYYHKIGDAMNHRCHPRLPFNADPWSGGWDFDMIEAYENYMQSHQPFAYEKISHGNWCYTLYRRHSVFYVQNLGLTDAILARMIMKESKPAHKIGLIKYAKQMVKLIRENDGPPTRGMYRKAVLEGRAPAWVKENLDSIEIIEKKIYNNHDFLENLGLAFSFPKRIKP